jgi:sodium transport system permease protein
LVLSVFALVLVAFFYASLALMQYGLLTILLVSEFGLLVLPVVALARLRRFPLAQTFSLRRPSWRSLAGSALIGLASSMAVGGLFSRLVTIPDELSSDILKWLLGNKPVPLWELWLLIAVTPAICEETFFRGFLLAGLRPWGSWAAISISALLFGLLHGSAYQFLPAFILGLLLGYAVWRSGSLYCGILIHVLNNGLIATLLWMNAGKDLANESVPWSLVLGALAIIGIGLALLTPPKSRLEPQAS